MSAKKIKLLVVMGPTASGKSELALFLAEHFAAEIISCDSISIYRYLDIGSAKPSLEARAKVVHHLIDQLDPSKDFSAADFRQLAAKKIAELNDQGKKIILVGGSGFYLKALLDGLSPLPQIPQRIKDQVKEKIANCGSQEAYRQLLKLDKKAAELIEANDRYRLAKALEVLTYSGQSITTFWQQKPAALPYQTLKIAIEIARNQLYQKIDSRMEEMFKKGLLNEVEMLLEKGYSDSIKPLQSVGYKQALAIIKKQQSYQQGLTEAKQKTRNFAKRQLTWFKADQKINWLPVQKAKEKSLILAERFFSDN